MTELAPSSARRWFAAQSALLADLQDRAVLLVSELVANSVVHSGISAPDEVEISVQQIPGGVHVEVTDHGAGIRDPSPSEPFHFGLRFVDEISERWGYDNDPTRVWFEIV